MSFFSLHPHQQTKSKNEGVCVIGLYISVYLHEIVFDSFMKIYIKILTYNF